MRTGGGHTCALMAPPPVGGMAELPVLETDAALDTAPSSALNTGVLAGLAAGGVLLLAGAAWYASRQWLRQP